MKLSKKPHILFTLLMVVLVAQAQHETGSTFVDAFLKNDISKAYSYFDDQLTKRISNEYLSQIYRSMLAQTGTFRSVSKAEIIKEKDSLTVMSYNVEFVRASLHLILTVNKNNNLISGFFIKPVENNSHYRVPAYVDENKMHKEEIVLERGSIKIAGQLLRPVALAMYPLVILVGGSGPCDRDETIGPNKPFRDIAMGISSEGIATFRMDKSTFTNKSFIPETLEEEYGLDLRLLVDHFKKDKNISKVILLGHSLGTMAVFEVAKDNKCVSALILMASNAEPIEDLIIQQSNYLLKYNSDSFRDSLGLLDMKLMAERIKAQQYNLLESKPLLFGTSAEYWKSLQRINTFDIAKRIKKPLLFLYGARDYQVPVTNIQRWKEVLSKKKNVSFKTYDKLNHLFVEGEGLSLPREYMEPKNVHEGVISDIVSWVKAQ